MVFGYLTMNLNQLVKRSAIVLASTCVVSMSSAQVTMSAMTSFGFNGDGWWAPGENGVTYLANDSNQRSIAYNPITGHLLLGTGTATVADIRVLDGTSGSALSTLNVTGISGGARILNAVGVSGDGQIFGVNLTTN